MRTVRCSSHLGIGVSAQGRGGMYTSPEFLPHAYENITFPQLRLRTVKTRLIELCHET